MEKLRENKDYEGNPIGLTKETATQMAKELDRHLASFITLYQQYHKHHWLVEGPQFRDLHLFFEANYTQVHEHYDKIAERLTVMGIAPTCHPEKVYKLSYVEHEPEGVFRIRDSLKNDMAAESKIAIELRKSIGKAMEMGDYGTKNLLEGILYLTEDRAHHIEHFLGEDTIFAPKPDLIET
ncbi:ferritin-like domain-containing protein [Telluribacter sp.]|uniref:ferritin-like domain-containing protein n=1 Tax=Telluribacter sp. TaxID=1978767 RepID=UPI002E145BDE|nr:ferritin-like domain-containing protein [Telluribacter sp.]